jgi:phosphatidylinositol-3-phosphatase
LRRQFAQRLRRGVTPSKRVRSTVLWLAVIAVVVGTGGASGDLSALRANASQESGLADGGLALPLYGHPGATLSPDAQTPSPSASPTAPSTQRHTGSGPKPKSGSDSPSSPPHVLVLVEENKDASLLSSAHYIDGLGATYASSSAWYGVDHPSAPNYVALLSGSTQSVVGDCTPPGCGPYAATSLPGQLTQAGIPWAAYMESMPSPCYTRPGAGEYAEKHDPFMYFDDVIHDGCAGDVLPYPGVTDLVSTLDGPDAPDFVWITPNLLDDMHDGSVAQGDAWARANIGPVLTSSWFTDYDSTVIITMDEGNQDASASCCGQPPGGPIPMVIVSSASAGVGTVAITGDQYGTLRSIEEEYGLPLLGEAADPRNGDLTSLFG